MTTLTKTGFWLTGTWVLLASLLFYFHLEEALTMPLNAWGGFFAGTTAPLALLWLVIGYFQNTEALKAQQKELNLQTAAIEQIAHVAISDHEQARRKAQPLLTYAGGSSGSSKNPAYMNVMKMGGGAYNSLLGDEPPNGLHLSPPPRWESQGDILRLTFNIPMGDDFFPFQFSFLYTDCFEHRYEARYEILSMSELFQVGEPRRLNTE